MVWELLVVMMQPPVTPMSDATPQTGSLRTGDTAPGRKAAAIARTDRFRLVDMALPADITTTRRSVPDDPMLFRAVTVVRERYRERAIRAGAFAWSIASLQRRVDQPGRVPHADGAAGRSWAVSADTGWSTPGGDRLSLGGRYTIERDATTSASSRHLHRRSAIGIVELGWDHAQRWRFAIGYRAITGGASSTPLQRGIDIANGAPIRERGVQAIVTMRPVTLQQVGDVVFGAQAVQAATSVAERLSGTASAGRDRSLSLFAHARF